MEKHTKMQNSEHEMQTCISCVFLCYFRRQPQRDLTAEDAESAENFLNL
jgi:hypothetical protein